VTASIPRPVPIGVNARGVPVWNGHEIGAFRVSHGVPVGEAARAMGISAAAVSSLYERETAPIAVRYDRIERYCQAVERIRARRDDRAAEALLLLKRRAPAARKAAAR